MKKAIILLFICAVFLTLTQLFETVLSQCHPACPKEMFCNCYGNNCYCSYSPRPPSAHCGSITCNPGCTCDWDFTCKCPRSMAKSYDNFKISGYKANTKKKNQDVVEKVIDLILSNLQDNDEKDE